MIPYIVLCIYFLITLLYIGFILFHLNCLDGDLSLKRARRARLIAISLNFIAIAFALFTLGHFILAILITIIGISCLIVLFLDGFYIFLELFSFHNVLPLFINIVFKVFIILSFIALRYAGSFNNLIIIMKNIIIKIFS